MKQSSLGDLLAAHQAITEFALVYSPQRCIYGSAFELSSALLRQRHCLDLHRIDTRQSADTVLLERHGCTICVRADVLRKQSCSLRDELLAIFFDVHGRIIAQE